MLYTSAHPGIPPRIFLSMESWYGCREIWREVVGDMDGNHIQSEPLGGLKSCMAADNDVVFVHDNGRTPAEFLDGIGDRLHRLVIEPGILVVGVDVREFHVCDLH